MMVYSFELYTSLSVCYHGRSDYLAVRAQSNIYHHHDSNFLLLYYGYEDKYALTDLICRVFVMDADLYKVFSAEYITTRYHEYPSDADR